MTISSNPSPLRKNKESLKRVSTSF
jgi:hypothetical protein